MNKGMQHWLAMVAVAVMLMATTGCDGVNGPRPTSVATLLEHSEAWQGEQVAVQGRVRSEDVPNRYWLEGEGQQRLDRFFEIVATPDR